MSHARAWLSVQVACNGCTEHDPEDFTPEIMYRAMKFFIYLQEWRSRGVYSMDLQALLTGGWEEVEWMSSTSGPHRHPEPMTLSGTEHCQ